jgi:MoaA/NifB/PqqE/SkfB family radical SAM enzyme
LRETHDRVRALSGSFDAAMASIHNLREAGIAVYANTQIDRWNAGELEAVLDVLVAQGVREWMMQITTAMGRAGDEEDLLLLGKAGVDI